MRSFRLALGPQTVDHLVALTQDDKTPFLAMGAAAWSDGERRENFRRIYGIMRVMDDQVDLLKSQGAQSGLSTHDHPKLISELEAACHSLAGGKGPSLFPWVLKSWLAAMVQDTRQSHFKTYRDLYRYSLGAAVAPGIIFLALATHPQPQDETTVGPLGAALARFCYAVHLARDLEVDSVAGVCNIPLDVLAGCGFDPDSFIEAVLAPAPSDQLRILLGHIESTARHFRQQTLRALGQMPTHWAPDARFSVHFVFRLYDLIFQRICGGLTTFKSDAFTPTASERTRTLHELLERDHSQVRCGVVDPGLLRA